MKKPLGIAAVVAAMSLVLSSASASVVPGELLGVFSGNDTAAGIMDNLGLNVEFLARIDTPSSIEASALSNDGLTIDNFTLNADDEAIAGQWSYSGPHIAAIIVLKAGSDYAVYLFNDTITDSMPNIGLWDTSDLDNMGLSHITAYRVVPLPAAAWLLLSGLGAIGWFRRA